MTTINGLGGGQPLPPSSLDHPAQSGGLAENQSTQTAAAVALPQYFSPVIQIDSDTGIAVLVTRDSQTGAEISQIPSQQAVAEYRRHMSAPSTPPAEPAEATQAGPATGTGSAGGAHTAPPPAPKAPAPVAEPHGASGKASSGH